MKYIPSPLPEPASTLSTEPAQPLDEDWFDRTVRIKRLGDPEIRRPEKPWHPLVYAGVHSELSYEDDGPRVSPQPARGA